MEHILELINDPNVNLLGAAFKLLLSVILGSMVGLERRRKGQIAGMRTFSLICMGATLAMLVSIYIPQEYLGLKNGDPGRIAAQVISGVGFLGAGAIINMKGSVKGLTTAAGIWATAAIGLAIGAGMYVISITAVVLILFVLTIAEGLEKKLFHVNESKIIRVKTRGIIENLTPYHKVLT
ncbi:MAG: MgtC/SapB family protein, partial [Prevotellaceae bacterium]|nr:MgtC/SapB family protein [Prevotellaceae bacterium]